MTSVRRRLAMCRTLRRTLRPILRRIVLASFAAGLAALGCGASLASAQFPFDREMLLDVAPMRPVKRVPILTVAANGAARIDLWCQTVAGRVQLADATIRIEAQPMPEALPPMMSDGQCTPARQQADLSMLSALTQVTAWRMQGGAVLLLGPTTLKFRPATN